MANLDELKKVAAEEGVELTEDMLAEIAGGAIPADEWNKMTPEEKKAAQIQSLLMLSKKLPCALS